MRHLASFAALAVTALVTGCADDALPGATTPGEVRSSAARITTSPDPADLAAVVRATNTFALDLHRTVASGTGNTVVSPYSVTSALGMALAGARTTTASQMRAALRLPATLADDRVHLALNALDRALVADTTQPTSRESPRPARLSVANSLWAQQGWTFQTPWLDTLASQYGVGVRTVDFTTAPDAARLAINGWVSERTNARIVDLLAPGSITADTVFALVNAVHFSAGWRRSFDPARTTTDAFTTAAGTSVRVPTMHSQGRLAYGDGEGYQAVSLAYQGTGLTMLVVAPTAGTFAAFERSLDAARLDAIASSLSDHMVTFAMPKFSFRTSVGLVDALRTLGMTDAFTAGSADFSGIDGTRRIFLSRAVHQGFIAVDENGTEAAAATALIGEAVSLPPPATLTLDRPFLFAIRGANGALLFVGRVTDPSAS